MDDLYWDDILAWSEQQAERLRRLAATERSNEIDWPNIIEEIESVGSEQLHAVNSLLVQALIHLLKAQAWPRARDVHHWRGEAVRFRSDAVRRFAPSMRQRLDLDTLYRQAVRALPAMNDNQALPPMPSECPWTLDELLSEDERGHGGTGNCGPKGSS